MCISVFAIGGNWLLSPFYSKLIFLGRVTNLLSIVMNFKQSLKIEFKKYALTLLEDTIEQDSK